MQGSGRSLSTYLENAFHELSKKMRTGAEKMDTLNSCAYSVNVNDYKNRINKLADQLDSFKYCDGTVLKTLRNYDSSVLNKDSQWIYLIPVQIFARFILDSLFEYKIYNGSSCVEKGFLNLLPGNCKDNCIVFQSKKTKKVRNYLKSDCLNCKPDSLKFQLVIHDPMNNTIVRWLKNKESKIALDSKALAKDMDTYCELLKKGPKRDSALACELIKNIHDNLMGFRQWMTSWLWFTEGKITIDPFHIIADKGLQSILDDIGQNNKDLANEKVLKAFYDSSLTNYAKRRIVFTNLDTLLSRRKMVEDDIETYSNNIKDDHKRIEKGYSRIMSIGIVNRTLYQGTLLVSKTGNILIQKQFDRSANYSAVYKNRWQKNRVTEIPENEKVFVLIQNLDSLTKVKLDERRLTFSDQEEFTQLISEQLTAIDFSGMPAGGVEKLRDFLGGVVSPARGSRLPWVNPNVSKTVCQCDTLLKIAANINNAVKNNQSIYTHSDIFGKSLSLKTQYSTLVLPTTSFEAPYRDSITIKEVPDKGEEADVSKTYIKVGALRYFQIAAGFAFVSHPVYSTTIDTSGNGFKVSSADNAAEPIVGVKFYPIRNYKRDKSIIPRYPFRRLSIFGCGDMLHPLNNFYVGGGYDLVPGLAFIVGNNFYLQTKYAVQNNQVTNTSNTYQSGGLFYSVIVNPVILVQFIKLFFK